MFSQSCGISPLCSDLIAVAVGAQSLPVCSLQAWWCCRSWAVIHFWEYFSGWDEHGQMWPFGCGAATWVQTRAALTKPGFGEEAMPTCTVHIYFGAKNCYKGMFGVGDVWNLCVFCGARHFGSKMLLFSPQTLRCTSPFLLFYGAERWPHPFFLWRGNFLLHSESLALTPLTTEQSGSL